MTRSRYLIPLIVLFALVSFYTPVTAQESTPNYFSTIITSTPQADGAIYHVVRENETLWGIAMAYGTTGEMIMTNTNNSPQAKDIYIGQVLVIRLPFPATETPTLTPTPTRITPQPTQPRNTITPRPTRTPLPTSTPTPTPPVFYRVFADSQTVGLTLTGISLVGLVLVLIFGFLKKK